MKRYYGFLFLLFFINSIYGQDAAVSALRLQQSPLLFGSGWIGAAVPVKDASGFYYNPAQLGNFSRENNFSIFFMPQKTDWHPNLSNNITFNSYSAALGYNFKKENNNIPLSIGIGYLHSKLDYGSKKIYSENNELIGVSNSNDSYDCFSVGASYDYYLLFNLGVTLKSYSSLLTEGQEATGTAFDFGTMITAPISKLFFNDFNIALDQKTFLKPEVNFTLGYALANFGDKVSFVDAAQSDPLPRSARLGYTFDFAVNISSSWNLNLIDYSFTVEADDILVEYDAAGNSKYQDIIGNINVGKNLINLKGDESVAVHKGHILRLFETIIVSSGRIDGNRYNNNKSNAFGISSDGLFTLLNVAIDNPVVDYITKHFTAEYYTADIFKDTVIQTNLKGLVVNFRGIEF